MNAAGLPPDGHCEPHFNADGYCQCPCEECTARLTRECWCPDCPCGERGENHWPSVAEVPAGKVDKGGALLCEPGGIPGYTVTSEHGYVSFRPETSGERKRRRAGG